MSSFKDQLTNGYLPLIHNRKMTPSERSCSYTLYRAPPPSPYIHTHKHRSASRKSQESTDTAERACLCHTSQLRSIQPACTFYHSTTFQANSKEKESLLLYSLGRSHQCSNVTDELHMSRNLFVFSSVLKKVFLFVSLIFFSF